MTGPAAPPTGQGLLMKPPRSQVHAMQGQGLRAQVGSEPVNRLWCTHGPRAIVMMSGHTWLQGLRSVVRAGRHAPHAIPCC